MAKRKIDTKDAVLVGKIKKLLNAGFPVGEIATFLNIDKDTVQKYKNMIDGCNK